MANRVRQAVQIVLDRMKSHPKDFEAGGRFTWVFKLMTNNALHQAGLSTEEETALRDAWQERNYQIFHDRVLESLLNPIEETDPFANVMTAQGSSLKPKLTTSQVAIAKRLGVTAKEYAELLKILE